MASTRRAVFAGAVALVAARLLPWPSAAREVPAFAADVAAARLPPLAERLPEEPLLIQPVERIGRYGGIWRAGLRGDGNTIGLIRMLGYEPLVAWDREWRNVMPHLAIAWEVSDKARVYTFRLGRGVRWSDGKPFAAEDIAFVVNDPFAHPDWPGGAPVWLRSGGGASRRGDRWVHRAVRFPRSARPAPAAPRHRPGNRSDHGPTRPLRAIPPGQQPERRAARARGQPP